MNKRLRTLRPERTNVTAAIIVIPVVMIAARFAAADQVAEILQASGVRGGLVVHVGCGDGKLTAALRTNDRFVVHGLDRETENVARARQHIQSLGLYGNVAVDLLTGPELPYVDNLVNLLVADNLNGVSPDEVMRVLAPRGVACIRQAKGSDLAKDLLAGSARVGPWALIVKPWPEEIDEWTHHLHSAGGNAVAGDRVVGPPRHLQWTAGPLWARSHGWTPSVSAMVSAGGRLFCIVDETLTCVDGTVPNQWRLVAHDAFNGMVLWKRPVPEWGSQAHSGTPDTGAGSTTGRFTMPPHVGKRLVAVGDTVYVTLGANAPITALDAATGEQVREFPQTARADEILCSGERLVVSLNPAERPHEVLPEKHICVVDVKSGKQLWQRGPFAAIRATKTQDPFGRLELAAGDGRVFVLARETIESLDADSGETVWRIDRPALPADAVRRIGFAGMFEYQLMVMVYHDGVVLLAQPEPNTHHTYHTMPGTLYAFDARDGRLMWKHGYGGWGHCTPPDVFVVGDVVWTHVDAKAEFGSSWGGGFRAKDPSQVNYRIQALDLRTGELRRELATQDLFNVGHHHRCYRNKITERFLMASRRGVEFVDFATGENTQNHWLRSGCLLGNLPCNGLLYVTPHPCGCYINAKLTGFNALAASRRAHAERASTPSLERLQKGPAYGKCGSRKSEVGIDGADSPASAIPNSAFRTPHSSDWPTYRHDGRRSGATQSRVATDLALAWQAQVGTVPSSPVIAQGKVFLAGPDTHNVYALDAADGKTLWQHTAGARVSSPPTIHDGMAIFGSADGRVYCLRSSDGELAWRFDAAPSRQRISAFGQLESPWPVPGSVLVHDDECWFAAGRSSYLDGGIHAFVLDPTTGKVIREQTIYSSDPESGKMTPVPDGHKMPGVLNDIHGSDGTNVFIRQQQVSSKEGPGGRHLYTTGGYLDPSWFNRTLWRVGRAETSGLMVLGDDVAYGVEVYSSRSRETVFKPGSNPYRLLCLPLKPAARDAESRRTKSAKTKPRRGRAVAPPRVWEQRVDIRITALVRAGDVIFAAGSPDIVDGDDPHGAWEGRKGGILAAFAADDGRELARYKLPSPPTWDGMAAARGRLYVSLQNGTIMCWGEAD